MEATTPAVAWLTPRDACRSLARLALSLSAFTCRIKEKGHTRLTQGMGQERKQSICWAGSRGRVSTAQHVLCAYGCQEPKPCWWLAHRARLRPATELVGGGRKEPPLCTGVWENRSPRARIAWEESYASPAPHARGRSRTLAPPPQPRGRRLCPHSVCWHSTCSPA